MRISNHIRHAVWAAGFAVSFAASGAGANALRPCSEDELNPKDDIAWADKDNVRPGPTPHITFRKGPDIAVEVGLAVHIDETGRPVCAGYPEDFDNGLYRLNMPRKSLGALAATWHYTPHVIDGKAVPAIVYEPVVVEREPGLVKDMPSAPLFSNRIDLAHTNCLGPCPSYHLILRGDGKVTFEGDRYTDLDGAISYTVSPGEVAALIERLRGRGIWSAHEAYWGAQTDASATLLTMQIGGRTRGIFDYLGESAGMPASIAVSEDEIDAIAGSKRWIHMTRDSLAELESLGFDFTSPQAGRSLTSMIFASNGDTDAIVDLIQRGAPIHDVAPRDKFSQSTPALTAAVARKRFALVPLLMDRGALLRDGKTDMDAVNETFQATVETANLPLIKTLLAYHPSLNYVPEDSYDKTTRSVLFLLPGDFSDEETVPSEDQSDIEGALRLLIIEGAEVQGHGRYGETLLHHMASTTPAIIHYLLSLGLDIDARDEFGNTPLIDSFDEDTALALLEAGADPMAVDNHGQGIWYRVRQLSWTRVPQWLVSHGYKRLEKI